MPLQKQLVSLPFTQGVDTKTDPKLAVKLARMENLVLRGGTPKRRFGARQLTFTMDSGGALPMGQALFPFNSELVYLGGGAAYSYAPAQNNWTTKPGVATACTHSVSPIVHKSSTQDDFDQAHANGITVTSWVDTGIHIAVYDEATGDRYQTGATAIASTSGYKGTRCVVVGKQILVFYVNPGAALYCSIVDTTAPETVPTKIQLETDLTGTTLSGGSYDAIACGSYAVVAYVTGAALSWHITLIAVNGSGAVLSSPAKTDRGAVGNSADGQLPNLLLHIDANNVGYVVNYYDAAHYLAFNAATFAQVKALTQIAATTPPPGFPLAAMAEPSAGNITVFLSGLCSSTDSAYAGQFMSYAVVTSSAITTALTSIPGTGGLGLQSDGFVVNGRACALVTNGLTQTGTPSLQPTGWVIDTAGNVYAKIMPGTAFSQAGQRVTRPFTAPSGATALLLGQQGPTSYTSADGTITTTTPRGVARVNLTPLLGSSAPPQLQLGQGVYVGGSEPRVYDGQEFVEAGHNMFPEGVTVSLGASGQLSAGAYQWRVVYTWISAQGEFQRSAPSPAVSATATATQKATLTIPTQRLCGRDIAGISTTQIEVYRTEANGSIFYRVSSVTSPTLNSITAATISYVDSTVTDAALVVNELLYTTGGVNDSIAPPGYAIACEHKTRLCVALLDDPFAWQSSSETIVGQMLRFNESWGGRVPASTGPITGMASMDGNLILFTSQAAYIVQGDGPDLSGNNNWPAPQRITGVDSGCVSANSVVSTPEGIVYKSPLGLMLLDRGLGTTYVGADVEGFNQFSILQATLRPELKQVWFFTGAPTDVGGYMLGNLVTSIYGPCLVWDYFYRQWSVLSQASGVDACYFNGLFAQLFSTGSVFLETPNAYMFTTIAGAPDFSTAVLETAWLKPSHLVKGFQRIWRMGLLGTYASSSTVTIEVAYSYSSVTPTVPDYTVLATFSGVGVFSGGETFDVRQHLPVQKCEAIKFRITDVPNNAVGPGTPGQGVELVSLDLEFAVKPTAYKLPSSQSF